MILMILIFVILLAILLLFVPFWSLVVLVMLGAGTFAVVLFLLNKLRNR